MFKAMGRGWVIGVSHFEGDERGGGGSDMFKVMARGGVRGVSHVQGDGSG